MVGCVYNQSYSAEMTIEVALSNKKTMTSVQGREQRSRAPPTVSPVQLVKRQCCPPGPEPLGWVPRPAH